MADIIKSGLLVLNEESTKFLVTMKADMSVPFWLMPGGKIEAGETPEQALVREIKEELNCAIEMDSLQHINDYDAPAAGMPGKMLHIKLYLGRLIGEPAASSEIAKLGWLGKEDTGNIEASETIRDYIIPDLIERDILQ